METASPSSAAGRPTTPRWWPAVAILAAVAAAVGVSLTPSINNAVRFGWMMLGPAVGLLAFLVWLLAASRLPARERLLGALLLLGLGLAASAACHPSVRVALFVHGLPLAMAATVAALAAGRELPARRRAGRLAGLLVLVWGAFCLLRLEGFDGQYLPEFSWRWSATPEERFLVDRPTAAPPAPPATAATAAAWEMGEPQWPGFRGPRRNGVAAGVVAPADWRRTPPTEAWRIPIGPGWSSFAAAGGRLFTQEQRGESELVSCYDAATGSLVWQRADAARFSEVVSGPGPRATPTLFAGRLYALGAQGLLSCLEARSGAVVWQRDLRAEFEASLPVWGFACSPLVLEGAVLVGVDGSQDRGLAAFDAATGTLRWTLAADGMNFSSCQPVEFGGQVLAVFGSRDGLVAADPRSGTAVWRFTPSRWRGPAVCQPQQLGADSLIVPLGDGVGVARLEVSRQGDVWSVREAWTTTRLKPSFNDFVVFENHLYGFDQNILACVDAATGERRWKQGRYGFGQAVLLEPAGQLLVQAESGEAVLVACDPQRFTELGRTGGLGGKTWNHPIVVGRRAVLRNGETAVSLDLPAASP